MKQFILILMAAFIGFTSTNAQETKSIDSDASVIAWKGYKVLGSHEGTLKVKSGSLTFNDAGLIGGEIIVDMTSLKVTDIEGEMAKNLAGHLSSPDFFATSEHPTAAIKITKVSSRGKPGDYKIKGDITIKNITKEISFNANIEDNSATAELQIDRSEFDVKYGSGSFFDNLGDNTIYDEFDLKINLLLN